MSTFDKITRAAGAAGFITLGGFHPRSLDVVPSLRNGDKPSTVVLLGNTGASMWAPFREALSSLPGEHPLDDWTRSCVGPVAEEFGADVIYPFDGPPYHPFQKWASRSAAVEPSPLGLFIHATFGMWFGLRGALLLGQVIDVPTRDNSDSPCLSCIERPCLHTCPVSAFDGHSYDVKTCAAHIQSPRGEDCMALGCSARRACPVGVEHAYGAPHFQFHMDAFSRAHGPTGSK
jgi:hypothetical protein